VNRTLRVVIIDDDDEVRTAMELVLIHLLPDVVNVASHHPDNYDAIDWEGCQVAVIDLMMPDRDGESILAELAQHHPDVYRVAWTATDRATRRRVAASGLAQTVVAKPGFDEILALLREIPKQ
jgi:DNA-binding NarL/FixJ family response regulator